MQCLFRIGKQNSYFCHIDELCLKWGGGNYKVAPVYVTNKHNQISTSRIFFEVNLDDPSN